MTLTPSTFGLVQYRMFLESLCFWGLSCCHLLNSIACLCLFSLECFLEAGTGVSGGGIVLELLP